MKQGVIVFYTSSARKDLQKLDKKHSQRIVSTIFKYTQLKPLDNSKALSGIFNGLYRYRVGDYRIIFDYSSLDNVPIVTILRIKHRKDIYRK